MTNTPDYTKQIWDQLKAITTGELLKALHKDLDWEFDKAEGGSKHNFRHKTKPPGLNTVCLHVNPTNKGGYRDFSFLKRILADIDWSIEDLVKLKLISKKTGKKKKE